MLNKMSNKKIGFSITELMVVVLVIGILASVSIPVYSDYITRSRISEGLVILDKLKQMSAEFYSSNGAFPTLANLNVASSNYVTNNISGVSITPTGSETQIAVAFNSAVGAGAGASLYVQSSSANASTSGIITWTCHSTTIIQKFLPSSCTNP